MIAARWATGVLLIVTVVAFVIADTLPARIILAILVLATLIAGLALTGVLSCSAWVGDIPADHPDALGSFDMWERGDT